MTSNEPATLHGCGGRTRPRKSVDTGKIEKLLAVTRNDATLRGRGDLAILAVLCGPACVAPS